MRVNTRVDMDESERALVEGGQGRSGEEVCRSGRVFVICLFAALAWCAVAAAWRMMR